MLKLFDGQSDTPELIWDGTMRGELRSVLAEQLDLCIQNRRLNGGDEDFILQPGVQVKYKKLDGYGLTVSSAFSPKISSWCTLDTDGSATATPASNSIATVSRAIWMSLPLVGADASN